MIFFAILSTKRQKTFNDGGRQTTIKKVHTGGNGKKTVCGDQPIKKEPPKKPSCTQMTFFPSYPTYPTLSYPILSFPFLSSPFLSFPFPSRPVHRSRFHSLSCPQSRSRSRFALISILILIRAAFF